VSALYTEYLSTVPQRRNKDTRHCTTGPWVRFQNEGVEERGRYTEREEQRGESEKERERKEEIEIKINMKNMKKEINGISVENEKGKKRE
jgi:hypothetical protein